MMKVLLLLLLLPFGLAAQNIRIIHGPYIQAIGEHEATIVWITDKDAVSWVELAPSGDDSFYSMERPQYYQTVNGNRVVGQLHKIRIPNLEKATEYRYRIFSKEVVQNDDSRIQYGKIASSDVYRKKPLRFRTLDKGKNTVSFSVVNDIHGKSDTLQALLKDVTYGKTDLVFFNGDMVSSMVDEKQFFAGFMDKSVEMFAGEVPVCFARGNHETRGPLSSKFHEYYSAPGGNLYYSFRQGPVYFIVLDGGEDKPDSDIEYSGLAQFDNYRSEQRDWLEKIILTEEFKTAPYRVVVIHIPPVESNWHGPRDINSKFLPLLNKAGISIMFCGHTHRYKYIEAGPGKVNFPILINTPFTSLKINADNQGMSIERRNTRGQVLDKFRIPTGNGIQ